MYHFIFVNMATRGSQPSWPWGCIYLEWQIWPIHDKASLIAVLLEEPTFLTSTHWPTLYTFYVLANMVPIGGQLSCPLGGGGCVHGSWSEWQILIITLFYTQFYSRLHFSWQYFIESTRVSWEVAQPMPRDMLCSLQSHEPETWLSLFY